MSSLAAARADNFWYPPNYDGKSSLAQITGQHPLRDRARKLDQGILIIRFEMPFNCWCGKCGHMIGKGVRFNAEKKAIGAYFTTKIWAFTMRAPCCQNRIEIHTDPKNARYIIVEGAREKAETWTAADAETMELETAAERAVLDDPLARLEHGIEDKRRAKETRSRLLELRVDAETKYADDYAMNKALRAKNRSKRKDEKQRDSRRRELGLPDTVLLLPEVPEDAQEAALVTFGDDRAFDKAQQAKRAAVLEGSIFSRAAVAAGQRQLAAAATAKAGRQRAAAFAAEQDAAAKRRAMLPSLAVSVPRAGGGGASAAAAIPTMERRDRSSLGRLVMPGAASAAHRQHVTGSDTSGNAQTVQSSRETVQATDCSNRSNRSVAALQQPAVIGGGAATSAVSVNTATGPKRTGHSARVSVVKRTSNTHEAQLTLKRRRIDQAVKLVMSEPVVRTKHREQGVPARQAS